MPGLRGADELDQPTAAQVTKVPFGRLIGAAELLDQLGLAELAVGPHLLNGPLLAIIVFWVIVAVCWDI